MKLLKIIAAAGAGLCLSAAVASATAINTDTLYEFGFGGSGSSLVGGTGYIPGTNPGTTPAPAPSWDFTLTSPGQLFVTDLFNSGDVFEIFNFGSSLGETSAATTGSNCGTDVTCAVNDKNFSSAVYFLAIGTYSITGIAKLSPFGGGAGAFIVTTSAVPVPAALPLLATGLGALGVVGLRRRRKAV
ncbi:VPLPA-CTERM sorting domain-containing protein [Aestuariivirga sp.]|uniref:VPLPA-CTERM sorting domain-containing protein n=1 Tax=Aestuariivirga sp. TaxID=2650926 RepID=UPI0039E2F9F9